MNTFNKLWGGDAEEAAAKIEEQRAEVAGNKQLGRTSPVP